MSIEEREDNELGELPSSLLQERREGADYVNEGTRYDGFFARSPFDNRNYGPPPDITAENQVRSRPGEMGSIPRRFDVTSTFDARPVNGRDFLETFNLFFTLDGGETDPVTEEDTFIVSDGYVGLIRGFRYFISNIQNLDNDSLLVSVLSDSVPLNNYDNMLLPQIVNDFIPTYGISNPLKNIGLRITHPIPPNLVGITTVQIRVELYGNLLLSRGIPSQYEPTNSV